MAILAIVPTTAAAASVSQSRLGVDIEAVASATTTPGPAPESFRDPDLAPLTPMPKGDKSGSDVTAFEVFVVNQYCRDVYGSIYWLSSTANPANCTQGYVKFYDSRNSQYLGAMDIYGYHWNMTRSTTLTKAVSWCTNNWLCSLIVGEVILKKVKPVYDKIRKVRWGL